MQDSDRDHRVAMMFAFNTTRRGKIRQRKLAKTLPSLALLTNRHAESFKSVVYFSLYKKEKIPVSLHNSRSEARIGIQESRDDMP